MTEGSLGYVLQQSLLNQLRLRGLKHYVVTVVTPVVVSREDSAFAEPTKPIGPFLTAEEARRRREELGWVVREDPQGRGWRRLVASPTPQRVIQRFMIRDAARAGHVVVACGGGGIPIHVRDDGSFEGVEAVVDKDLTSAVLGTNIGAELLIILTAVPKVYLNFRQPDERALDAVTLEEVERFYAEGQFPPGSMGPKIAAVMNFLQHGGRRALITDPDSLPRALEGRAGTHFIGRL
jgi:carbamate kinase